MSYNCGYIGLSTLKIRAYFQPTFNLKTSSIISVRTNYVEFRTGTEDIFDFFQPFNLGYDYKQRKER